MNKASRIHFMKNRWPAFLFGLLAALLMLELILRLIGIGYLFSKHSRGLLGDDRRHDLVVLCVGDSFTEGIGAPAHASYPAQLERQFKESALNLKVRVVNRGQGGSNSTMVLSRFARDLDAVSPDIVVILAGGSNYWNVYGYSRYLDGVSVWDRLLELGNSIRLVRLARLLIMNIDDIKKDLVKRSSGKASKEGADLLWVQANESQWVEGDPNKTIETYRQILAINPQDQGAYAALGVEYWGRDKNLSRKYFQQSINIDPAWYMSYVYYASRFLINQEGEGEDVDFFLRHQQNNQVVKDILRFLCNRDQFKKNFRRWVLSDVKTMVDMARQRKIKVVLQEYPEYNHNFDGLNKALRTFARKEGILFVEHGPVFDKLIKSGRGRDEYFAPDRSHCNDKGYGVMALNLYNAIIAHGFTNGSQQ